MTNRKPAPRLNVADKVRDLISGFETTIEQIDAVKMDSGRFENFYLLADNVPCTPDHPDRYRHAAEIAKV